MANEMSTLQPAALEPRAATAERIINDHSLFAAGAGLIPVDGLDVAATIGIQINMIRDLAKLYQVEFNDHILRVILTTSVSASIPRLMGEVFNYLGATKWLKVLGSSLSASAVSAWLTTEIGLLYREHFEQGGTLDTLRVEDVRAYIDRQLDSGHFSLMQFIQLPNLMKRLMDRF